MFSRVGTDQISSSNCIPGTCELELWHFQYEGSTGTSFVIVHHGSVNHRFEKMAHSAMVTQSTSRVCPRAGLAINTLTKEHLSRGKLRESCRMKKYEFLAAIWRMYPNGSISWNGLNRNQLATTTNWIIQHHRRVCLVPMWSCCLFVAPLSGHIWHRIAYPVMINIFRRWLLGSGRAKFWRFRVPFKSCFVCDTNTWCNSTLDKQGPACWTGKKTCFRGLESHQVWRWSLMICALCVYLFVWWCLDRGLVMSSLSSNRLGTRVQAKCDTVPVCDDPGRWGLECWPDLAAYSWGPSWNSKKLQSLAVIRSALIHAWRRARACKFVCKASVYFLRFLSKSSLNVWTSRLRV